MPAAFPPPDKPQYHNYYTWDHKLLFNSQRYLSSCMPLLTTTTKHTAEQNTANVAGSNKEHRRGKGKKSCFNHCHRGFFSTERLVHLLSIWPPRNSKFMQKSRTAVVVGDDSSYAVSVQQPREPHNSHLLQLHRGCFPTTAQACSTPQCSGGGRGDPSEAGTQGDRRAAKVTALIVTQWDKEVGKHQSTAKIHCETTGHGHQYRSTAWTKARKD